MGVGKNEITELEKAAIYYGVFHGLNIESIYKIVNPTGNPEYMRQKGNQWRRTNRISEYYQTIVTFKKKRDEEQDELAKLRRGNQPEDDGIKTDFTNKEEFIKYLNGAANRVQDDKLRNDILKMLSDHLDFKDEQKRDDSSQVQRFYLPLRCQDCKLYQEKLTETE